MLEKLPESHLGISKSKQLARDNIFWSGRSSEIEVKFQDAKYATAVLAIRGLHMLSYSRGNMPLNVLDVSLH